MRDAGYSTSAFLSNSNAYYLAEGLPNAYDFLPEPTYQQGGLEHLWDATTPLHQNSGVGSRLQEYCGILWRDYPTTSTSGIVQSPASNTGRNCSPKCPMVFFFWST